MRKNDLSVIPLSFLRMLAGNTDICERKMPRMWKAHGEINVGKSSTPFGLVGTQYVGQDLKVHLVEFTVSGNKVHAMTIFALLFARDVSHQINRALLVSTTSWILARRTVLAHVLRSVVWNKRIEILPICRPSGLQVKEKGRVHEDLVVIRAKSHFETPIFTTYAGFDIGAIHHPPIRRAKVAILQVGHVVVETIVRTIHGSGGEQTQKGQNFHLDGCIIPTTRNSIYGNERMHGE
jgi:hypothetical protein